jgi:hypothetical protein
MRQVFFLLVSAMVVAFSLSWASPGSREFQFIVPDEVILPLDHSIQQQLEISTFVSLMDSCEKIESLHHEIRESRIILTVRISRLNDRLCLQQVRSNIPVNFVLDSVSMNSSKQVDVYFRESEEGLKYFGSIALK